MRTCRRFTSPNKARRFEKKPTASSSKAEAEDALDAASRALGSRRLKLNREKTRIVGPGEPFEFLGYQFTADGRILPPPSIPSVVARRMIDFAERYGSRASAGISLTTQKTRSVLDRLVHRLRKTKGE